MLVTYQRCLRLTFKLFVSFDSFRLKYSIRMSFNKVKQINDFGLN